LELEKLERPESLSTMALRELRSAIVDGRLKLGDQLSEIRLSNMLGISKTPVREALKELRREGLVQIDPQRGTSIFLIDHDEIAQISDFRVLLETAAARRVFAGDRTDARRKMRAVVQAMHEALERGDVLAYRRLDSDFHHVLIEGCANAYIAAGYSLVSAKIGALITRALDDEHVVDRSLGMHSRICELLEAGDEEAFCALLTHHIRNTERDYRAWLSRQQELATAAERQAAG